MQTQDEMTAQMDGIATYVEVLLRAHEREAHGGRACMANRASAVAFFAHRLGVRSEAWQVAEGLLRKYDAECKETDCMHGITPTPTEPRGSTESSQ